VYKNITNENQKLKNNCRTSEIVSIDFFEDTIQTKYYYEVPPLKNKKNTFEKTAIQTINVKPGREKKLQSIKKKHAFATKPETAAYNS
jgi:hypothetical protein